MEDWIYNEFIHCGVDYSTKKTSDDYDENQQKFRNYKKEFDALLNFIEIEDTQNKHLIELGCGTGALTLNAAQYFKKVYAVDVSIEMLNKAQIKQKEQNISNIEFINAGFLSYVHQEPKVDLVITKAALHHLPDFWKQVAFLNINKMLKLDGIFYLFDVIFQFNPEDYKREVSKWINEFGKIAGENFKHEVICHIKDEFSTFSWIIKGMIEKAGFQIVKEDNNDNFIMQYKCRKIKDYV